MKNVGLITRRAALARVTALMSAGACITDVLGGSAASAQAKRPVIGMLPKFLSDPYFVAVDRGAQEAAKELEVTARTGDIIMGLRHKTLPIHGVQFHPESIASEHGHKILENFLKIAGEHPTQQKKKAA